MSKAGENMRGKDRLPQISNEVLCAEYEAIYRYVLSLCRNDAEAQDITQDAFVKAMKSSGSFEGDSSLYTWLCAIAKNVWLDRCRKNKREMPAEMPENSTVSDDIPLEQQMADRDMAMQIHRVLHEISEPYKEVFSLRVFGQLPFADIASLFGKTESWARVTYHRARKMISDTMRKDGYDG